MSNYLNMVQYRAIQLQWPTNRKSYSLWNGTIFNDLERPKPKFQSHSIILG